MHQERFIKRHSLQTRITHDTVAICCCTLIVTGLFVFIPALAAWNPDVTRGMRMLHRVCGTILIVVPIVSACMAPKGVQRFFKKYFVKWTPEDWEFMKKFVPYMLNCKKVHMPDQDEVKSGQRVADGLLVVSALLMAISGVVLWMGIDVFHASEATLGTMRFVHDLFFLILVIFVVAHIFLGAGIFQPYRGGMIHLMFGNGEVSESNALYHWGFWARKELESGANVVIENVDDNGKIIKSKKDKKD
jgi:formate dehydrogenase subunit gamma